MSFWREKKVCQKERGARGCGKKHIFLYLSLLCDAGSLDRNEISSLLTCLGIADNEGDVDDVRKFCFWKRYNTYFGCIYYLFVYLFIHLFFVYLYFSAFYFSMKIIKELDADGSGHVDREEFLE